MKELYDVVQSFWHKGVWTPEGSTLRLTETEAKYLGGIVTKKKPLAVPAATPEAPSA